MEFNSGFKGLSKQHYGHYDIWQSCLVPWRKPCSSLHTPKHPRSA